MYHAPVFALSLIHICRLLSVHVAQEVPMTNERRNYLGLSKEFSYLIKFRLDVYKRQTHERKIRYISTTMYVTKKDITSGFKIKNQQIIDRCEDVYKRQV